MLPSETGDLLGVARSALKLDGEISTDNAAADSTRCRLPPSTRLHCWEFSRNQYPDAAIREAPSQGYCSFTLYLDRDSIIQFRPPAHRIDLTVVNLAQRVYEGLAPPTRFLGTLGAGDGHDAPSLHVYFMSRIPGVSLADIWYNSPIPSGLYYSDDQEPLIKDFALLFARGWNSSLSHTDSALISRKGKIGISLRWRLERMLSELPRRFHPTVAHVLHALPRIEALPWVLTHGDLVPSNIMVERASDESNANGPTPLRLAGLLDWAEAEYLPAGVGFYGLEELLGRTTTTGIRNGAGRPYPPPDSSFAYSPAADNLRVIFWQELETAVPVLATDALLRETVRDARLLGILLWHGIAFDDGKLNRVVQEGRDDHEIQRLDVILLGAEHGERLP
ncbi:hypothetical protein B0H67DRAFT_646538 [Lasiosphaeris hirsuta]|uniref:Aminoglycoside phosphotransferase domain-containing protein n=1 Tax=Lasiosphaeris hirsuta TaxID=260670 RepID=A0AA40A8G1_9PEZI|nr:hypothetical protein B0H67DRAFT_646538 [Lasiosphaeris hirsuta]